MLTKKIENTIFTVFFDSVGKKPAGMIITMLDNRGQTDSMDKIYIKDCKILSDMIFDMGESMNDESNLE